MQIESSTKHLHKQHQGRDLTAYGETCHQSRNFDNDETVMDLEIGYLSSTGAMIHESVA